VRLHDVFDETKIAARLAVAVDNNRLLSQQGGDPPGNHGRIRAVRILAWAEDIKVAEADAGQAIGARKHVRINLVHQLGRRVRGKRAAGLVFDFWQVRVISIGRTAGCVNEPPHVGAARRYQHVEESVDVTLVTGDRILQGTRDRAQRRLV